MEFIGLKVLAMVAFVGGLAYLYHRYKNSIPSPITAGVDALTAEAQALITKLEDFVKAEGEALAAKVEAQASANAEIAKIQADIQKATDFATKVKSIL